MYFIKLTKDNVIHGLQFIFIIFSIIQLLNDAIIAALLGVVVVYIIGALEYMWYNMIGPNCPPIYPDENSVIDNKDIAYINTNYKKEFLEWCREKDD